jgi:tetratricopeptide (TPR) repeat protein
MKPLKGLTLHNPYIAVTEKQAADVLAEHACICCGKSDSYFSGDKGKEKKAGAVVYFQVGMKCMCGFINFVYLVCNDLKSYQKKRCMPAAEALQEAENKGLLGNFSLREMLIKTQVKVYTQKAEEALQLSTSCVEQYPGNASAVYNHGCILMLHQRHDEAVPFFRRAIELDSKFISCWYQLAQLYRYKREFQNALLCFDTFLKLAPHHKEARQSRTKCLQEQNELITT